MWPHLAHTTERPTGSKRPKRTHQPIPATSSPTLTQSWLLGQPCVGCACREQTTTSEDSTHQRAHTIGGQALVSNTACRCKSACACECVCVVLSCGRRRPRTKEWSMYSASRHWRRHPCACVCACVGVVCFRLVAEQRQLQQWRAQVATERGLWLHGPSVARLVELGACT